MNRTGLVISALIAIVGTAKILFPQSVIPLFTLDAIVAVYAVLIAVIASGIWFGPLKFLSGSVLLGTLGLASIIFAIGSVLSPTLLGLRDSFIPIVDTFIILETGIVLSMIGLEKKPAKVRTPLLFVSIVWSLLQRRIHRLGRTATASQ